jgi:hypothetical protein
VPVLAVVVYAAAAELTPRVAAQTPDVSALQAQIQALEARLKKLEDRLNRPLSVKAPFIVEDERGISIIQVASDGQEVRGRRAFRGLQMFNDANQQVAVMNVIDKGAIVKLMKEGSGSHAVTIAATEETTGFLLRDGSETPRVSIRAEEGTGYALRVLNPTGTLAASIGHTSGGEGLLELFRPGAKLAAQIGAPAGKATALRIFDQGGNVAVGAGIDTLGQHSVVVTSGGHQVARMIGATAGFGAVDILAKGASVAKMSSVDDGRGVINISRGGTAIAALTQGATGGGLLQLGNAEGALMVEAGTTASGAGIVRTGPMALPMLPGIPGSFILGKR